MPEQRIRVLTPEDAATRFQPLFGANSLRISSMPGYGNLPTLNTAAASVVTGNTGASVIPSSVLINPWDTTAFTYTGTVPTFAGTTFPDYTYFGSNPVANMPTQAVYPSTYTSTSPWAVEFDFDTTDSRFEFYMKGTGGVARLLVNNQYVTAGNTFPTASNGSGYSQLVNLPTPGSYRIRVEMSTAVSFGGIRTIPGNSVRATSKRPLRCLVQGDSFSEPSISDSTTFASAGDGWPQKFAYMTGWDVWSAAKGGTGYTNAGTAVAIPDRMTDITRNNPDVVIFAAGINDHSASTPAQIGAAALTSFQAVRTANPNAAIIVLSPFWPRGYTTWPTKLIAASDQIKASATSVGALFLDVLRFPAPLWGVQGNEPVPAAGTITASTAVSATSFSSATRYPTNTIVQIGSDDNAEGRRVTAVSGTGPWTHTVAAMTNTHASGSAVTPFGGSYITGTGRQGATTGDGTADRFTGTDNTHPTAAGHENIARVVYHLLTTQLSR